MIYHTIMDINNNNNNNNDNDKNKISREVNFFEAIKCLFYATKVLGVLPFSLKEFYRNRNFTISSVGNAYSLVCLVIYVVVHHFSVAAMYFQGNIFETGSTLTIIIGLFILYTEPAMMAIDTIALLINQRHLLRCIARLEALDRKLAHENIKINYNTLQRISCSLIVGASIRKYLMIFFAYMAFTTSLWNVFCIYLPIYISSLSKVWFIVLLYNIRMKFTAMNSYLELLGTNLTALKQRNADSMANKEDIPIHIHRHDTNGSASADDDLSLLHREIRPQVQRILRFNGRNDIVLIRPYESNGWMIANGDTMDMPNKRLMHRQMSYPEPLSDYPTSCHKTTTQTLNIADKFDLKLTKLCYWHDEICGIGKIVNVLFSFQMLVLMAYAFLSITAQFYFVYCGLVQQNVPLLFKSAEYISISLVYFASTAFCCVFIIYMCWETKNASNQMGVFLHKVANVVDENHFYETVNHLSLKLLNHRINFTACGFFALDMTTVYAITGAITSYLIILIQFNVAAQRGKHLLYNNSTMRQY